MVDEAVQAPAKGIQTTFSASLVSVLAAHPNIAGMKDTSKEEISIYINAVPKGAHYCVMAGTIEKFYLGLMLGAVGGVLSMANYLPDMCCRLQELQETGNHEEVRKLDLYARRLSKNAAGNYGVAGVKAAIDLLGYIMAETPEIRRAQMRPGRPPGPARGFRAPVVRPETDRDRTGWPARSSGPGPRVSAGLVSKA